MRPLPRKVVITIISGLFILVLFGYIYFQSRNYIAGPRIYISYPLNGSTVYGEEIEIRGKTERVSTLLLNDYNVLISPDGTFSEKLMPALGYNIMKFVAKDRFGKQTEKLLEFIATSTPTKTDAPVEN